MVAVYNTFGDAEAVRPQAGYKKYSEWSTLFVSSSCDVDRHLIFDLFAVATLGAAWITLVVAAVLIVGKRRAHGSVRCARIH
jgi:hypothetical protein